jgi:hypothetical protein
MEIKWKTYSHIHHPYGDLIWHLFWGIVVGATLIWAILARDFWLLVISFLALIFFFHPKFYEPKLMEIKINEKGIFIDKKFHPWKKFYAFEIFDNGLRKFIFLFPKRFSFGLHFPLEEFFVSEEEVRNLIKKFLEEYQGKVPILDKLYRSFYL